MFVCASRTSRRRDAWLDFRRSESHDRKLSPQVFHYYSCVWSSSIFCTARICSRMGVCMSRIFDLRTSRVSTVWSTYLCLEWCCMSCMSCMIHIARIFRVLYYVAWVLYTINSTYHIIHSTLIHVPLGGMGICVMAHGSRTHKFAGMGTVWHDSCTNDTYMRSFAPVGAEMICSAS